MLVGEDKLLDTCNDYSLGMVLQRKTILYVFVVLAP